MYTVLVIYNCRQGNSNIIPTIYGILFSKNVHALSDDEFICIFKCDTKAE